MGRVPPFDLTSCGDGLVMRSCINLKGAGMLRGISAKKNGGHEEDSKALARMIFSAFCGRDCPRLSHERKDTRDNSTI